jgi:hypothetical protein
LRSKSRVCQSSRKIERKVYSVNEAQEGANFSTRRSDQQTLQVRIYYLDSSGIEQMAIFTSSQDLESFDPRQVVQLKLALEGLARQMGQVLLSVQLETITPVRIRTESFFAPF